MTHKLWLTALVAAIFIGGSAGLVIWNESKSGTPSTPDTDPGTDSLTSATPVTSYSLSEIAKHGDATSCWTMIEDKVYDLTEYIEKHPGGSKAILAICGEDGTSSFNAMPAGVMTAARLALSKFVIGDYAKN